MSEANAEDKDQHLEYSDPFQSPTELMGSDTSMRRMFVVQYSCPLCGQEHSCEIYLTLIASNENEMMQKALQTLNRDDVKLNTLAPFMKEYHQQEEDYLQRATAYAKQEIRYPFQVTAVAMTDEDSYTCEHCQMTFETIGAWRRHDGRNANRGERLSGEDGIPLCQK